MGDKAGRLGNPCNKGEISGRGTPYLSGRISRLWTIHLEITARKVIASCGTRHGSQSAAGSRYRVTEKTGAGWRLGSSEEPCDPPLRPASTHRPAA